MAARFTIPRGLVRAYDIRGRVGAHEDGEIDEAVAHAIGRGFGTRVRRAGGRVVAVGRDGRTSSPMLEEALVAGLVASGTDVVRVGLGPSPMLYFAEATLPVDGGVQVTGSHNQPQDNGFKLVHRHASVFGASLAALADGCAAGDCEAGSGHVEEVDLLGRYVADLAAALDGVAGAETLRIGWDAGSGAAGPAIQALVRLLPGEHHLLFTQIDGTFPHHHPDPTIDANLAPLATLVAEKRLHFGVAFDGDGDRIGAVDADGNVVRGDTLLALLAGPVLAANPGATVVADVKTSAAVFETVRRAGGNPVMYKTGHSHMKAKLAETGAALAGELSGHIFFGRAAGGRGYDDALLAAVRLIALVAGAGRPLHELVADLPPSCATPELRFPVPAARRAAIVPEIAARLVARGAELVDIDGLRVTAPDGWWLLRGSNTEAMLTARAEAKDEAGLARVLAALDAELAASGVRR